MKTPKLKFKFLTVSAEAEGIQAIYATIALCLAGILAITLIVTAYADSSAPEKSIAVVNRIID